jgi:hypothetical protein
MTEKKQLECPECGEPLKVELENRFNTRAVACTHAETKNMPIICNFIRLQWILVKTRVGKPC